MRQRSVQRMLALAIAASSFGGSAFAQSPPGPPATAATRPGADGARPDGPPRGDWQGRPERPRGWLGRDMAASPEEWESIAAFMSLNNPVRLELLKRIEDSLGGADRPIAGQIRRTLTARFRELDALKQRRPELYSFALTRLQLEDNILGALRDLKAPDAKKDAIDAKLNEKIRASVDNSLAERRARIEQLANALERERKSLADDSTKIDELSAKQRDKFEKEMNAMLDFDAQNGPATTQAADAGR